MPYYAPIFIKGCNNCSANSKKRFVPHTCFCVMKRPEIELCDRWYMNEEDRLALIQTIIHLENNMVQPGINIKKEK